MLKIERTVLPYPEQWEIIIEGMRNPKNSWDRIDSYKTHIENPETLNTADFAFFLGEKDHKLMDTLNAGGPVHAKYRRMIPVYVTITAPLYWWKEFDTYKIGTVCNSCSTMHKIHSKEFTLDDFSRDHIDGTYVCAKRGDETFAPWDILNLTIDGLNHHREKYLKVCDSLKNRDHTESEKRRLKLMAKSHWWQMIQLLPSSYNQKRTIMLNYEVLVGIYKWRRDHKLYEWHVFCDWIEQLPYSELITGKNLDNTAEG